MANFYVDLEGGNDANDGTTFANRRKSILAVTAAQLAPGDTIRVMASKPVESLGVNGTFTNKSATVTLSSALNVLIDECDVGWTASGGNVSASAVTAARRNGTGAAFNSILVGFTTGMVSFKALGGAQDYSAYQGITLWVLVQGIALAASTLSIRLCSDAAGVTTVDTLPLPAITQINQWIPVHIDKGSALGASIQSIALYQDIDPGAITVLLDNISTTKASSGTDCLTLKSLIGKNTAGETFWGIRAISGVTVTLDHTPSMAVAATARGYSGTTATVAAYHRTPIATPLVAATGTAVQTIAEAGSSGSRNTVSGGWNRTDMSTQTDETWCDGSSGFGSGFVPLSFVDVNNLNFVRYTIGMSVGGAVSTPGYGVAGTTVHCNNCAGTGLSIAPVSGFAIGTAICAANLNGALLNAASVASTITALTCVSNGHSATTDKAGVTLSSGFLTIGTLICNNNNYFGLSFTSSSTFQNVVITTLTCTDNGATGVASSASCLAGNWRVGTVICNANGGLTQGYGWDISGGMWRGTRSLVIESLTCNTNTNYGVVVGQASGVVIKNLSTTGNSVSIQGATTGVDDFTYILKSSLAEATKVTPTAATAGSTQSGVVLRNFNGAAGDHRTYLGTHGTIFSEASVRHTASGLSWAFLPLSTTYITAASPMKKVIAKVVCAASALVTVKAWVRRTNTGLTAKLVCPGGQIGGVSADVVATITALADTWEELTITFTPSETGTVEIEYQVYGGTTFSAYIDDMTVSQA